MSALEISLTVLAFVFGGAMLGLHLQTILPEHHLSSNSKDAVKLATGIIATMAALLLGLLVSSAKSSFDEINSELVASAANVVMFDRTLANYGPETKEIRSILKKYYTSRVVIVTSDNANQLKKLDSLETVAELESVRTKVLQLTPANDAQRQFQAQATQTINDILHARWLIMLQNSSTISMPLMILLVVWLTIVFVTFGIFSPPNHTVKSVLFLSALSVSGAIFLILELNSPLTGFVTISKAAMFSAIAHLGI